MILENLKTLWTNFEKIYRNYSKLWKFYSNFRVIKNIYKNCEKI